MPQPELSVLAVEEGLEGGVLAEVVLDLAHDFTDPGVERLIGEALVDPMQGGSIHRLSDRPFAQAAQWADRPKSRGRGRPVGPFAVSRMVG